MGSKLLYNNVLTLNTPTATTTATGYSVLNLRDFRPYTYWKSNTTAIHYITVDCLTAQTVNAIGIYSHNLNTCAADIYVQSSPDNAVWTTRSGSAIEAADDTTPILKTFTEISARYWRVKIENLSAAAQIGIIHVGYAIETEYPPETPYSPFEESIVPDAPVSKSGQLLGVNVRFNPIRINARFTIITRTWLQNNFEYFWYNHGRQLKPFFFAWDLTNRANEVYYVRLTKESVFRTPYSINTIIDELSLQMEGLSHEL